MYRILNVRQIPGEDFKAWFTDDYWDLFVWVDKNKRISSFQLGYGKPSDERIVSWKRGGKVSAMTVDNGEDNLTANRTPVMVADADFDREKILAKFLADSKKVNKQIVDFVAAKISTYSH